MSLSWGLKGGGGGGGMCSGNAISLSPDLVSAHAGHCVSVSPQRRRLLQKASFFVFTYMYMYSMLTVSFSTHQSLSLWSACYLDRRNLLWKIDFESCHFETVSASKPCLCDVICSDSKLAARRKICSWLGILGDFPLHHLLGYHFAVWRMFSSK